MSDRLGSLLKEAADDSLGDARLQPPNELPEARSGHRRTWLAAAAVVVVAAAGLGAWALGSGSERSVDTVTTPHEERLLSDEKSKETVAAAFARLNSDEWVAEFTPDGAQSPLVYHHVPPDPATGRLRQFRLDVSGSPSSVISGLELWTESLRGTWARFALLPGARIQMPVPVLFGAVTGDDQSIVGDIYDPSSARHLGGDWFAIAPASNFGCADGSDTDRFTPTCELEVEVRDGRVRSTQMLDGTWTGSSVDANATFEYPPLSRDQILSPEELAALPPEVSPFPTLNPAPAVGCDGQVLYEGDQHFDWGERQSVLWFRFDVVVDPLIDEETWIASHADVVGIQLVPPDCSRFFQSISIRIGEYTEFFKGAPWLTDDLLEFAREAKRTKWGFE